jgi:membrane peptidoglycan carboxypeptidase
MAHKSLARRTARRRLPPRRLGRQQAKSGVAATLARAFAVLLVVTLLTAGGATALVGGSAYAAYGQVTDALEGRLDTIEQTSQQAFQTSRIYDRNGVLLYEFFNTGRRTKVSIGDIDRDLINATIAIEDKTFYQNTGVDFEGIAKALVRSLQAGEETGGASTITQQLIKRVVLEDEELAYENRYRRKVAEIILARELSERYSKDQILELYLNEIFYGNLAYGIQAAAETYFGTSASDLTLAQASLLAGLPQLPTVYNPIEYLENDRLPGARVGPDWLTDNDDLPPNLSPPRLRQIDVLRQMVDEGYATKEEAMRAIRSDLVFARQEVPLNAPHFVFYVKRLLEEKYPKQLATGGLVITTTLDLSLNQMVQQKAAERIEELKERNIHNAAVVVMQPRTSQILSMVGSIDYNSTVPTTTPGKSGNVMDGQVNVTVAERQPGSALKPFTYLAAMEHGATPGTIYWDVPTQFLASATASIDEAAYAPLNYSGKFNGPVRIRTALANSLNIPPVLALQQTGINETLDLLYRVGITGLQRGADFYGLSLTLGGGEVTPLDLTTAYNTLASGGYYLPPQPFLQISAPDGSLAPDGTRDGVADVLEDNTQPPDLSQQQPVVDPRLVAIISDMLADDRARQAVWGLNSPLKLSRPAAVKTGTTNDWRDAWAAGYTPYVTVGVWTGNNNNEETAQVESLSGGGIIWRNVMEELFANEQYQALLAAPYPNGQIPIDFPQVPGVERKPICPLPGPYGGYSEELFTSDMTVPKCDFGRRVTLLKIDEERMCVPQQGVEYPAEQLVTETQYSFPPTVPEVRANYGAWGGNRLGNVPACDDSVLKPTPTPSPTAGPVAPPVAGAIRMPDLIGYGENQAKDILAALGIPVSQVYPDYQNRQRAPDAFDKYPPYAVISTLPRAGDWIVPGTTVVLGIRAPEEAAPAASPAPAPPEATTPPAPSAPPAAPEPAPSAPPTPQPAAPEPQLPIAPPATPPVDGQPVTVP